MVRNTVEDLFLIDLSLDKSFATERIVSSLRKACLVGAAGAMSVCIVAAAVVGVMMPSIQEIAAVQAMEATTVEARTELESERVLLQHHELHTARVRRNGEMRHHTLRILNVVSDVIPDGAHVGFMSIQQGGFQIRGYAHRATDIASFVDSMHRALPSFRVSVDRVARSSLQGHAAEEFVIQGRADKPCLKESECEGAL